MLKFSKISLSSSLNLREFRKGVKRQRRNSQITNKPKVITVIPHESGNNRLLIADLVSPFEALMSLFSQY